MKTKAATKMRKAGAKRKPAQRAHDNRSATPVDMELGRRLRVARTDAGLSQQALAERLGITFQQIQKYEKGANRIAASRLTDIARNLDQTTGYFLDGL